MSNGISVFKLNQFQGHLDEPYKTVNGWKNNKPEGSYKEHRSHNATTSGPTMQEQTNYIHSILISTSDETQKSND